MSPDARDIVEQIIAEAIRMKASHIHIEPEENVLQVRLRIDGLLHKQPDLLRDKAGVVVARCKELAGLDAAKTQIPQQGQVTVGNGSAQVVFEVSTCPTLHGENVVFTALREHAAVPALDALGMSSPELRVYRGLIGSGCGMMLVSGPVGSGTTTTLYASLRAVSSPGRKIVAAEEGASYRLAGVYQAVVGASAENSYSAVVRSLLRQDPDVMLIGDLRDSETAGIAVQAALTSRLVFAASHDDDAVSALEKLREKDIDPVLLSSALLGVMAQRLVRRLCDRCKEAYRPDAQLVRELGLADRAGSRFYRARGCAACGGSGYRGWAGIYELLRMTPALQQLVLERAGAAALRRQAVRDGMRTLRALAVEKMLLGLTSAEEVLRVSIVGE